MLPALERDSGKRSIAEQRGNASRLKVGMREPPEKVASVPSMVPFDVSAPPRPNPNCRRQAEQESGGPKFINYHVTFLSLVEAVRR